MVNPERLIAIGDIHGESDRLEHLLEQITPTQNDQLVFLGDYIDRGLNSRRVIEHLIALSRQYPQTIFLRGNHEQMLLEARVEVGADDYAVTSNGNFMRLYRAALTLWLVNGGEATLRSYGVTDLARLPKAHVEFIKATRLFWQSGIFLFVHAGADPDTPLPDQDPATLLQSRRCPPGRNGVTHIVGHTPTADGLPQFENGRIRLDTGAVYGYSLTACDVRTQEYWQA